jgi:hypothetical protein
MTMRNRTSLSLIALLLLTCYLAPAARAADPMPTFTVAYFNGACPAGWTEQSLASAVGRILLPTPRGGGASGFVGDALASQEEGSHAHGKATGSITSAAKEFVLIGGCCNGSLGHSGTYSMNGSAKTGHSGLPYLQLMACVKTDPPSTGSIPADILVFSIVPCAAPFTPYNAAAGRFVVGLNPNGQPAATFGGANLQPSEVRTHSHTMNGSMSFPQHDIAGASGCCAHNYAQSGSVGFTGNTVVDTSVGPFDSAVQAPYYTLFLCETP